ncbi:GNAT family N-acetyltransferase [Bordetella bronchialis]|nr:GNAT family N-acetyltransferase [Bordetella bronchialis]
MPPHPSDILVRRLSAADATAFHALRLRALEECPSAFAADLDDERQYAEATVAGRIAPPDRRQGGCVGAFDGTALVGMACLRRGMGGKAKHKATLVSVYIAPPYRGTGLSPRLLGAAIELAREMPGVRRINLSVTADNKAAMALYRRLGFEIYGREVEALCVDGTYHDEYLMARALTPPGISYAPVGEADFDELADLRIAAMRDSLERVGRFDPERARRRLRENYAPQDTFAILLDGARVGFYTLRRDGGALKLDHLYIAPGFQGRGTGAAVLQRIFEQADAAGMAVRVGALRDSPSNRFYRRHGFVPVAEETWDIYYERAPQGHAPAGS